MLDTGLEIRKTHLAVAFVSQYRTVALRDVLNFNPICSISLSLICARLPGLTGYFVQMVFLYTNCMMSWTFRNLSKILGGGFKDFLFSSLFGEDSHFDSTNIFQRGWNHQLELEGFPFNKQMSCLQGNLFLKNWATTVALPQTSAGILIGLGLYDFMCFQTHRIHETGIYLPNYIWLIFMVNVDISYHAWILLEMKYDLPDI